MIKYAVPEVNDGFGNKLSGDESTDFDIGEYNRVSALGLRESTYFQFEIEGGSVAYFKTDKGVKNQVKVGGFEYARKGIVRGQGNRGTGALKSGIPIYFERMNTKGDKIVNAAQIVFYDKKTASNFYNRYNKLFKDRFK
ncbi:hypothetical protein [Bacteroides acidifaciens]|uniref:hypothetical protein n=1 Tax=Bacteroides acidifaciens TaxID=85831 RepID=UPI0023D37F65|nr:hypothetical protein [Bacteroides acidifaciens]MDE6821086.1 hypothetical protein [Bacteroides acidifaciens]